MSKMKSSLCVLALMAWAVVAVSGCAPKSPEEKVAQLRSYYTARAVGFLVESTPEAPVEAELAEDGEPAEADGASGDEEMAGVEAEPVAVRQDVKIDILLQHDSPEKLPGVTLDITMADASQAELAHWKVWIDTATLPKATGTQFTHVLEDIDYEEGYGFSVEVRHPIPVEERGEYREFAEAGDAG